MTSDNTIVLNIMGVNYPVKGDIDAEVIKRIGEDIEARMLEISDQMVTKSVEKTAVLTALNLEYELYYMQEERGNLIKKISKRVNKLVNRIDKALMEIEGN